MESEGDIRRSDRKRGRSLEFIMPTKKKKLTHQPRKWKNAEIKKYLECLQKYGHKNFAKLQEHLPNKTVDDIKAYFMTKRHKAILNLNVPAVDKWLSFCEVEAEKQNAMKSTDSIQIAQVIKYLSIDGLLENHPLPENCQGIDFLAAYRFIYQALMGYPIQPVNKDTAEFIYETFEELSKSVPLSAECDLIKTHLKDFNGTKDNVNSDNNVLPVVNQPVNNAVVNMPEKKSIKMYQRKKKPEPTDQVPLITLRIESSQQQGSACSSECFTINVDGSNSGTTVDVPKGSLLPKTNKELIDELHKSVSFNPFQIPERWLKECKKIQPVKKRPDLYLEYFGDRSKLF